MWAGGPTWPRTSKQKKKKKKSLHTTKLNKRARPLPNILTLPRSLYCNYYLPHDNSPRRSRHRSVARVAATPACPPMLIIGQRSGLPANDSGLAERSRIASLTTLPRACSVQWSSVVAFRSRKPPFLDLGGSTARKGQRREISAPLRLGG